MQHFHGEDIPDDDHAAVDGRDDSRKKIDHAHDSGEQGHYPDAPGFERGAGGGQCCTLVLFHGFSEVE